jgi:DNA-binding NtrC family response regulator
MEAWEEARFVRPQPASLALPTSVPLREVERRLLEQTLAAHNGNRSRAAEVLGVSLRTVRNKIRQYGLPPRGSYVHD